MDDVRITSEWVASHASHVSISPEGIGKLAEKIGYEVPTVNWDEEIHYCDGGPLTTQYLLVLDALNFCFWPDEVLQYDHLASGLTTALKKDPSVLDARTLQTYTGPMLRQLIQWPRPLPLEDERARLLNELGMELEYHFEGQASNLVAAAKGSAINLVHLVTQHFPGHTGFRDHCVYKGHQIFLYKRAQIFVADVWGAFKGEGLGSFRDIASITTFADYVVPAVLRHWGVLAFSSPLARRVDEKQEVPSGSEEEVEIRACTITAVEKIRERIQAKTKKQVAEMKNECSSFGTIWLFEFTLDAFIHECFCNQVLSVHLDWWLWSAGLAESTAPHHRTRTIYY